MRNDKSAPMTAREAEAFHVAVGLGLASKAPTIEVLTVLAAKVVASLRSTSRDSEVREAAERLSQAVALRVDWAALDDLNRQPVAILDRPSARIVQPQADRSEAAPTRNGWWTTHVCGAVQRDVVGESHEGGTIKAVRCSGCGEWFEGRVSPGWAGRPTHTLDAGDA